MDNEIRLKCEKLSQLRDKKADLEDQLKNINIDIQNIQNDLVNLWQENDLTQIKYDDLGTFYVHKDMRARCINEDTFHSYLKENGEEAMIKSAIPHQTLSAWVRRSEMSKEEMERLGLSVYEQFSIRVRR